MMQKNLPAIKGELFNHFSEIYINMHARQEDGKTIIDYENLGLEVELCIREVFAIKTISDLDKFCDDWGLNEYDDDFPLSFPNLAKKYI
jgi:hypothetical protein